MDWPLLPIIYMLHCAVITLSHWTIFVCSIWLFNVLLVCLYWPVEFYAPICRTALTGPCVSSVPCTGLGTCQKHNVYLHSFIRYLEGSLIFSSSGPSYLNGGGGVLNVRKIATHIQHLVWLELSMNEVRWNVLYH